MKEAQNVADEAGKEAQKIADKAKTAADEAQKAATEAQKAANDAFANLGITESAAGIIKNRILRTNKPDEDYLKYFEKHCCLDYTIHCLECNWNRCNYGVTKDNTGKFNNYLNSQQNVQILQIKAKEALKAADDAQRVALEVQKAVDEVMVEAKKSAETAADEAHRVAEKATDEAHKAAEKASNNAQKIADEAADEAQKAAEKAQKAADEAKKIAIETQKAANKASAEAQETSEKAAKQAQKVADEAGKKAQETANEAQKVAVEAHKAADEALKAADAAFANLGITDSAAEIIKSRILRSKQPEEDFLKYFEKYCSVEHNTVEHLVPIPFRCPDVVVKERSFAPKCHCVPVGGAYSDQRNLC